MSIFFLVLLLLIFDQLSKFIILKNFHPGDSFPVIENIFHISFVANKGGAFGIFSDQNFFFILFSCVFIFGIAFVLFIHKKNFHIRKSRQVFLALILSGATGNLIDRIRLGFVIDFLDFRIWPVFNIADSAITVGIVLLLLQILKERKL